MRGSIVLVTALAATPALPCSIFVPGTADGRYDVDGRDDVPLNAELRVHTVFEDSSTRLVGPDGDVSVSFVVDAVGGRYVPDVPLVAGEHRFELRRSSEEPEPFRTVAFTVVDAEDTEPPPAPTATARVETKGDLFPYDCGESVQWPRDFVQVDVESVDDAVGFTIDGGTLQPMIDGVGVARFVEDAPGSVSHDVVVRDLAGNVSEVTTAEAWAGCAGGCASSSALPLSSALLLMLARRRRLR